MSYTEQVTKKLAIHSIPQLSSSDAKRKGKEIRSKYVQAISGLGDLA